MNFPPAHKVIKKSQKIFINIWKRFQTIHYEDNNNDNSNNNNNNNNNNNINNHNHNNSNNNKKDGYDIYKKLH